MFQKCKLIVTNGGLWEGNVQRNRKRQSGLSWQAERTERESKRDGAMERRCFSALSNNALATSVAEIKSSGAYLDIYPCVTFSL